MGSEFSLAVMQTAMPGEAQGTIVTSDSVSSMFVPKEIKEYKVGEILLEQYKVEEVMAGGMGKVYIANHQSWKVKIAIKSPKKEMLADPQKIAIVVKEAENWNELGMHPNIAYCYFVRELDRVPHIFIEYIDGGNLTNWIEEPSCKDLRVSLDLAIQFCHGMAFAHSKGLIHQDIKPDNVLLTRSGTLKITDFGIARRVVVDETSGAITNTEGPVGMTRKYASPEQWNDPHNIGFESDIFSFGVCLWEMLCGVNPFDTPPVFAGIQRDIPDPTKHNPKLPESLCSLLFDLVSFGVEDRKKLRGFAALRDRLKTIFQELFHEPSPHSDLEKVDLLADGLNNRAVSLIELGKKNEAISILEKALEIEKSHTHSFFNRNLLSWRNGKITDIEAVRQLEIFAQIRRDEWFPQYFLGVVHMERGDKESALMALSEAGKKVPESEDVKNAVRKIQEEKNWSGLIRTFDERHTSSIYSVNFSPDGRYALSGSRDTTIRLWNVDSGKCLRTFSGHVDNVRSVSFSPDGRYALSGSRDTTLRLWDIDTGKCQRTFTGHTDAARSVSFSADGRFAISGSADKTLRLWEIDTGACLRTFVGHTDDVRSVSFSPDGRYALSGSLDKTLRFWEIETGKCLRIIEGHTSIVYSVGFSHDGRFALSGSWDKTLRLWEIETGKCLRIFEGHTGDVRSVSFSPDGRHALSGSLDKTVRLWEIESGKCLRTFEGHAKRVYSVRFSPDGRFALSGSPDKTLRLWSIGSFIETPLILVKPQGFAELKGFSENFTTFIERAEGYFSSGSVKKAAENLISALGLPGYRQAERALHLWNLNGSKGKKCGLRSGWFSKEFRGHTNDVLSVSFSPDGRHALSGSKDKTFQLWEIKTGNALKTFGGHAGNVDSVSFSPDGRFALSGSVATVRFWEIETGKCLKTFEGHTDNVPSVSFSPDGYYALSGSWDTTVRLWKIETGKCVRTFKGHTDSVYSVSFSPDARYALSGGGDATIRQWEIETGAFVRTLKGHTNTVASVCFSPDGRYALSGSFDKTLRLWEIETGKCIRVFDGHTNFVFSVCFSPDGRYALSGSFDKTLRLWEIETGKCVRALDGHTNFVYSVKFSSDGRFAISGSVDKTLRLWEFEWDYEFPELQDWTEGARPFLEIFLSLHTPYVDNLAYAGNFPSERDTSSDKMSLALTRKGKPTWTEGDFQKLLEKLSYAGFGWLQPEGVRKRLEEMKSERM